MAQISQEYQLFRRILCVCPCCGELVRVSELKLKAKGKAPRTWLDDHEKSQLALAKEEDEFSQQEKALRAIAQEKGRKQAEKVITKSMCQSLRTLKLDPLDIKPILSPIDFVVFKGMNKEDSVSNVMLLSRKHNCPELDGIHKQIGTAVGKKKYEWQVARIDEEGSITFEK